MFYIPGVRILWPQNNERCSSIQTHMQKHLLLALLFVPNEYTFYCCTCKYRNTKFKFGVTYSTNFNLNLRGILARETSMCERLSCPCVFHEAMEGMEVPQYAFLILALDARWVVTFTFQPFYLLVPLELAAGWNPPPVWIFWEKWNLLPCWKLNNSLVAQPTASKELGMLTLNVEHNYICLY